MVGIDVGWEGAEVGDGFEGFREAEEVRVPTVDEEVFPRGRKGEVADGLLSGGEEDGGGPRFFLEIPADYGGVRAGDGGEELMQLRGEVARLRGSRRD